MELVTFYSKGDTIDVSISGGGGGGGLGTINTLYASPFSFFDAAEVTGELNLGKLCGGSTSYVVSVIQISVSILVFTRLVLVKL